MNRKQLEARLTALEETATEQLVWITALQTALLQKAVITAEELDKLRAFYTASADQMTEHFKQHGTGESDAPD